LRLLGDVDFTSIKDNLDNVHIVVLGEDDVELVPEGANMFEADNTIGVISLFNFKRTILKAMLLLSEHDRTFELLLSDDVVGEEDELSSEKDFSELG